MGRLDRGIRGTDVRIIGFSGGGGGGGGIALGTHGDNQKVRKSDGCDGGKGCDECEIGRRVTPTRATANAASYYSVFGRCCCVFLAHFGCTLFIAVGGEGVKGLCGTKSTQISRFRKIQCLLTIYVRIVSVKPEDFLLFDASETYVES